MLVIYTMTEFDYEEEATKIRLDKIGIEYRVANLKNLASISISDKETRHSIMKQITDIYQEFDAKVRVLLDSLKCHAEGNADLSINEIRQNYNVVYQDTQKHFEDLVKDKRLVQK